MNRKCPNCLQHSVAVSGLVVSDTYCSNCHSRIGVQWLFKALFFIIVLVATIAVGAIVLVAYGMYAAILFISLPIGAIGYIKARFCPLVVRDSREPVSHSTGQGL